MPGLLPLFPMCCSSVLRILLPAAQLVKIPCMVDPSHTRVLCCRTWNRMQFTNSPYRTACGQIEALHPDRACLACYLCSPCVAVLFRGGCCLHLNQRRYHACLILHTLACWGVVHGTAYKTRTHPTAQHADKSRHRIKETICYGKSVFKPRQGCY